MKLIKHQKNFVNISHTKLYSNCNKNVEKMARFQARPCVKLGFLSTDFHETHN